jgi:RNA polymerase sigma-70 factor (ECF subfamily)
MSIAAPASDHARPDTAQELERHRHELQAHCRRMLGSPAEADDAVQETMLRAWRAGERFEGRSSLGTWLHRIATNVCLDMLQAPQRRARPPVVPPGDTDAPVDENGPDEVVARRDALRRAFVVALARLPARQRTALVLGDVFRWRATEVAELLGTSVAAANSARQRGRATLRAGWPASEPGRSPASGPDDTDGRGRQDGEGLGDGVGVELAARCLDAFERYDIEGLARLLGVDHPPGAPGAG